MTKQVQEAYIVAAVRTPVGKAPRGMFSNVRPDDMLAHVLQGALAQVPGLDPADIDDVIVGCAMPEAEQGMNVARIGVLLAGLPDTRAGDDRQPLLLLGRAGGGARRRPHPHRRRRRDDRRRHRVDVHGADDGQQGRAERGGVPRRRERRHRLRHGHDRGEGRAAMEGLARGPGRVRRGEPPEGLEGDRRGRLQRRDPALEIVRPRPTSPRAAWCTASAWPTSTKARARIPRCRPWAS